MTTTKTEQEIVHARQTRILWFGMLTGPIAWLVDLQIRYAWATTSCGAGNKWKMALTTVCSAALTLVAAIASYSVYKRIAAVRMDEPGLDMTIATRVKFMASAGVVISLFFAIVILVASIPLFFFTPCDY